MARVHYKDAIGLRRQLAQLAQLFDRLLNGAALVHHHPLARQVMAHCSSSYWIESSNACRSADSSARDTSLRISFRDRAHAFAKLGQVLSMCFEHAMLVEETRHLVKALLQTRFGSKSGGRNANVV